ncbi:MAG: methyl-accepting chemotaxis protein [Halobacteriaceae archaeon]
MADDTRRTPVLWRVRESYATKLVTAFLLVVVVIGGIGGYIYVSTSDAVASDTRDQLQTRATMQATQIDDWVQSSKSTARLLSRSGAVQTGDKEWIQSYTQDLIEGGNLTAGARAVHVVDVESTEIVTSSLQRRIGATPREEGAPWAQHDLHALSTDEVLVTAFQPTSANTTVVTFVTPVKGRTQRALVYVTDAGAVVDQLAHSSDTEYTTVVNANGTVVLDSQNPGLIGTQHEPGPGVDSHSVEQALAGETGYASATHQGDGDVVTAYASVEGADWAVLVHEQRGVAFALVDSVTRNLAALLAVVVLGFVAVGLTIGQNTLRDVQTLTGRAGAMEAGDLDVDLDTDRRDEIGDLYRAFDAMRDSLRETIEEAEQAREDAEAARERSEALVDHLESKAADFRETMEATAAGDLTSRMDPDSESEAMTDIARAFNDMVATLESTVGEVKSFASSVAEESQAASEGVADVRDASEQVSVSVQEISDGASTQSDQLETVANEMNDLSATIEEIASTATEVAERSTEAAERGAEGNELASDALDEMAGIEETAEETVTAVEALADQMREIGEVIEVIDDIAEETNLLALNANIEAARADGDGDGFAVVADEVKSLAEQTQDRAAEIESLVGDLREQTDGSVADMQEMRDRVEAGTDTIGAALDEMEAIVDLVEEANRGVQEISDATDDQATSTEEVVAMVDDVAAISEEQTSESESVAAAAEEQTTSLSTVEEGTDRLADRAGDLRELLAGFRVADAETAGPATGDRPAGSAAATDD